MLAIEHFMLPSDSTYLETELTTRLEAMAADLAKARAEAATGAAAVALVEDRRRREAAEKRQAALTSFFEKPLQHQARPRAEPEVLGKGYTARNISSGFFANPLLLLEKLTNVSQGI